MTSYIKLAQGGLAGISYRYVYGPIFAPVKSKPVVKVPEVAAPFIGLHDPVVDELTKFVKFNICDGRPLPVGGTLLHTFTEDVTVAFG